jgi:hypothetical protein
LYLCKFGGQDDILLFGLRPNAADPAALEVAGDTLQVEPYGCMLRTQESTPRLHRHLCGEKAALSPQDARRIT